MAKEDEYREYALKTVELATRAGSGSDKNRLLALAERWTELAERAAKVARERLRRSHFDTGGASKTADGSDRPAAD